MFLTSSFFLFANVEGNIFGNIFNNIGSENSINGTIKIIANGTSRNMSAVVRFNCCLSRRVKFFPLTTLVRSRVEILISAHRSLPPIL